MFEMHQDQISFYADWIESAHINDNDKKYFSRYVTSSKKEKKREKEIAADLTRVLYILDDVECTVLLVDHPNRILCYTQY